MPQVKAAPSEEFATKLRTARPRGLSRYRSRRALLLTVFPSIMLPIFLAVIDQTIVATALPAIARSLGEVERQLILATLEQYDGDKKRAAEVLGISLKTLYNRLNLYKRD